MENIKDVLMRVHNLKEEEAQLIVEKVKKQIAGGKSPEEAMLDEYSSDIEVLTEILNPLVTK